MLCPECKQEITRSKRAKTCSIECAQARHRVQQLASYHRRKEINPRKSEIGRSARRREYMRKYHRKHSERIATKRLERLYGKENVKQYQF